MYVIYRRPNIRGLDKMILNLAEYDFQNYQQYSRHFGKTVVLYGDTNVAIQRLKGRTIFSFDQDKLVTLLPSKNEIFGGYTKILETERFNVRKYLSRLDNSEESPLEICFNNDLQLSLGLFTVSLAHLIDELVSLHPESSIIGLSEGIRYQTLPAEKILLEYQERKRSGAIEPLFSVRLYGGKSELKPKTVLGCVRCRI